MTRISVREKSSLYNDLDYRSLYSTGVPAYLSNTESSPAVLEDAPGTSKHVPISMLLSLLAAVPAILTLHILAGYSR